MSTYSTYKFLRVTWEVTFGGAQGFEEVMAWHDGNMDRPRHWHNADRVAACLAELSRLVRENVLTDVTQKLVDGRVANAAIFFRNAVYDVGSYLGEAKSAQLYRSFAARTIWDDFIRSPEQVKAVCQAILGTYHLSGAPADLSPTSKLVADVDVLFLGADGFKPLVEYEDKIRREYDDFSRSAYPNFPADERDEQYFVFRMDALTRLKFDAERGTLFKTPEISSRYSARAASNLSFLLGLVEGRRGSGGAR